MRLCGSGERFIERSPTEVLETALNPWRYALADHKIGRILAAERRGNRGFIRARARLGWVQTPALTLNFVLHDRRGIELSSRAHRLLRFRASFECKELPGGTWVRHVEQLELPWLPRLPGAPLMERRFSASVARELTRLKRLLEA